jgi:translation initiation factor IF-1
MNKEKVALGQLRGDREQMHYVKLLPGDVLQLHLVTPKVVHIAEK